MTTIQEKIDQLPSAEKELLSDGYHSFKDLYGHRIQLWKALIKSKLLDSNNGIKVYKCLAHHDGTKYDGWFLSLIVLPDGKQISYHLPMSEYKSTCGVECKQSPIVFDGHSSKDVLERIALL